MLFDRKKADIKIIIMHCSASDLKEHDNVETIRQWHLARGWKDIGYHFVITRDGTVHDGRNVLFTGAHCQKHNYDSIGICLTGRKIFKWKQFVAAKKLCERLFDEFSISKNDVYPHNHFDNMKTCPNYLISDIWAELKGEIK